MYLGIDLGTSEVKALVIDENLGHLPHCGATLGVEGQALGFVVNLDFFVGQRARFEQAFGRFALGAGGFGIDSDLEGHAPDFRC